MRSTTHHPWHVAAISFAFSLSLLLTWIVFSPGLFGPFFFDDVVHLQKLAGAGEGINSVADLVRLLFPEHGGSGRSIAYLSLLIDDTGWPSVPQVFKHTNILIHLLNGVLVFALLRKLTELMRTPGSTDPQQDWVALIGATLWLLHPLQLSPTMMVIQRMTLLGGLFTLLALLAYLEGRRVAPKRPIAAALWLVPAFGSALLLGILSKETAFMTIGYVLVLESTVMGPDRPPRPRWWRGWSVVFLKLPLGLLILYLLNNAASIRGAYGARSFDLSERLMTEGRVLIQYLRVILLPSLTQSTPFRDDFTISHGLLHPPSTLIALLGIFLLLGLAVRGRRRYPLFALAILWFFVGHALEATVLPLELYFEHRNYLPMLGIIIAAAYGTVALSAPYRRWVGLGMFGMIVLEAAITFQSARVWGNQEAIAVFWSAERPGSQRAQVVALNYYADRHDWPNLRLQLDRATAAQPDNPTYPLYRYAAGHCVEPERPVLGESFAEVERSIPGAAFSFASLEAIQWMLDGIRNGRCRIDPHEMQRIFDLYLDNPRFTSNREVHKQLLSLLAGLRLQQGDLDGTITALDRAYAAAPSFSIALDQAYFLVSAGLIDDAQRYVELAKRTPPSNAYDWLEKDARIARSLNMIHEARERF